MPISTVVKNLNDGELTLKDGTGTPVTLVVPCTVGDATIQGLRAASGITDEYNEVTAYEARGKLTGVRHTARHYPSGSLSCQLRGLTSASVGEVLDFIRQTNAYSGNLSTLAAGANADVYTILIQLKIEGTSHGDNADAIITLDDCYCTADVAEGDPDTITINYICYGAITVTGTTA